MAKRIPAYMVIIAAVALAFAAGNAIAEKKDKKNTSAEINIIRQGLNDPDREVRGLAARTLGELRDKDSIEAIRSLLVDSSDQIKIRAAVALAKVGDKSGIAELRRILSTRPKFSQNPTAIERARAIAKGTTRAEAAYYLGELVDFDSVPLLRDMLEDNDGRVADASMIALAKLGDSSARKRFLSALESTNQGVRTKAAEALGEIGDASCLPALRKRLSDWDRDVKTASMIAVAKLKDKESVAVLKASLADKDDSVREKAVLALGMISSPDSAADLKKMLQDTNGLVRIAAAQALHQLGDDSGKDFLLRVLKTDDRDAKLRALAVLENIVKSSDAAEFQPLTLVTDKTIAISAAKVAVIAGNRK